MREKGGGVRIPTRGQALWYSTLGKYICTLWGELSVPNVTYHVIIVDDHVIGVSLHRPEVVVVVIVVVVLQKE